MSVERWWNDTDRGNRNTGRISCALQILHGLTWLGSDSSRSSERPATNLLSHGTRQKLT